jgi:hypothetical protein
VCPQKAVEFQHLLTGEWNEVITMDLIHCRVCGEPLYTSLYEQKLASELNQATEALCPQHQQRQAASRLPLVASLKTETKLGG